LREQEKQGVQDFTISSTFGSPEAAAVKKSTCKAVMALYNSEVLQSSRATSKSQKRNKTMKL